MSTAIQKPEVREADDQTKSRGEIYITAANEQLVDSTHEHDNSTVTINSRTTASSGEERASLSSVMAVSSVKSGGVRGIEPTRRTTVSSSEDIASFSSVMAVSSFSSELFSSHNSEEKMSRGGGSPGEKQSDEKQSDSDRRVTQLPEKIIKGAPTAATSTSNISNTDPYWEYLFTTLSPRLLDPQDMHSTLDATISNMINNLSPVEVSFIRRRVKDSYRSIHHNPDSGGSGAGNNGESVAAGIASGNSGVVNSVSNDGGGGSSSQSRFSLTKTVGRLVGYSSTPSSLDADDSHKNRHSQPLHPSHPALDESFDRTTLSKTIYQKDKLMDITMMRKIFEGGDRCLRRLRLDARKSMNQTVNVCNGDDGGGGNGRTTIGGSYHGFKGSSSSITNIEPHRRRSFPAASRFPQQHLNGDKNPSEDIIAVPTTADEDCTQPSDVEAIEKVDVYGSAYLLLLYMSEIRWDYIAEVAKLSATSVGLTMDVNNLVLAEEKNKEEGKQSKATTSSAAAFPTVTMNKSIPDPPRPPSFTPPSELYDQTDLKINEPCGVSLSSICFLISMALRGTRRQKLNLLFFLLLPPKELNSILASHPAGGLPTWLLEIDDDVVFSFDSFSYYYHYHGVMLPTFSPTSAQHEHITTTEQIPLCIDAKSSIEIFATLVAESLGKQLSQDSSVIYGVRRLHHVQSEEEDTMTLSSMKCQKVREALLRASQCGNFTATSADNINRSETAQIDNFVHSCNTLINNSTTSNFGGGRHDWTMNEFATWADGSINDSVLNRIMCQLFGTGILPTAQMERHLVAQRWIDWNLRQSEKVDKPIIEKCGGPPTPSRIGLRRIFMSNDSDHSSSDDVTEDLGDLNCIWGGIGGADGLGGLGNGVLHCIDKQWWNDWVDYTGWKQVIHADPMNSSAARSLRRPKEISNEQLIDRSTGSHVVSGSYEPMKQSENYVLVPPGVWNVLYEMYGGGPPLPRMVLPNNEITETNMNGDGNRHVVSIHDESVEVSSPESNKQPYPKAIPASVRVATHPWVLQCLLCDPHQPYRRGDTGTTSIRIMAMPEQPLWRLFAEIVVRLPIHHAKARDSHGEGKVRLWKFDAKAAIAGNRYGPWALLCNNRFAEIPISTPFYDKHKERWETYTDQYSVAKAGLSDGMHIMLEFAIINKDGSVTWPREAAAKVTTARIIASEDATFRNLLRGLDDRGEPLNTSIIRQPVDAMDSKGRWYEAIIVDVDNNKNDLELDNPIESHVTRDTSSNDTPVHFRENTNIRVYFFDHAGDQEEWIGVNSDRLAVRGRMTASTMQNPDSETNNELNNLSSEPKLEPKSRLSTGNKKKDIIDASADYTSNPMCLFPSYGACGLINLGNTCYANSGWQCMSYLPLLRSYLLSGQFMINGDLNRDNPLGTGGKILEEFSELLRLMWSGKYGARAPQKFRASLAKVRSQYCGTDQQDAQELINDMFDMLHEDGNRVKKKPIVDALEDGFIEKAELPRLGREAWRRFLRRNRSIISDLSMGQVYNRVTCPECNHSSRNFDPFSILSLPFPTVAEVIFQCTVVRRASALNCPNTLLHIGNQSDKRKKTSAANAKITPPSKELILEEYFIPMSRLADIGDLRKKIQHVSGIHVNNLRLYNKEDIASNAHEKSDSFVNMYTKVSLLPDKQGPCLKLLQHASSDSKTSPTIAKIIAFESTLRVRPIDLQHDSELADDASTTASEMSTDSSSPAHAENCTKHGDSNIVHKYLKVYGDANECVVYDTNPTPLAKAISRNLWPKTTDDFTLGLRVDAFDHRNHWFSGSVIEIVKECTKNDTNPEIESTAEPVTKVKIHFDNFSSKWDETYTIESFTEGRVCPLYSHATPRPKPTEFIVHHRLFDRARKMHHFFGQSFAIQCHNEWSTARAGAHILAQAARFLEVFHYNNSENVNILDAVDRKIAEKDRHDARREIARAIDVLIKSDQQFAKSVIHHGKESDVTSMSRKLNKQLQEILPLLPFEIRVTSANSPLESNNGEEVSFPFSLVRAIGNYMNARHALVLHWLEKPDSRNKMKQVLYSPPYLASCPRNRELSDAPLKETDPAVKRQPSSMQKGLHIGACLTEFCKEQQLDATGCWRCPKCKVEREGKQSMTLWNLPDLLTFHLKRFNASSRWREKITTKVDFPLTGLNMREWCDAESPLCEKTDDEAFIYDLVGVVNHFGGMTGGHYVATCKATACSPDGDEEVAYNFNGADIANSDRSEGEIATSSGWRIGRTREKESTTNALSRAVAASAEPLWLQFDDDIVEPAPPVNYQSETAYVLFYRRRRMHPASIAKYSSIGL